jgi:2-polyprenyl-3-methyl-5-hydroxy-6-metoxy-1,4-benzoquinol methylase
VVETRLYGEMHREYAGGMLGTVTKQLFQALGRYISFHTGRILGRNSTSLPSSTERSAAVMGLRTAVDQPTYQPRQSFDWRVLSEPSTQLYGGGPSDALLDLLVHEPKFVLDVGCSLGDFAAVIKARFPQSRVWGIEPNGQAAAMARRRIERVLCQPIEQVDWEQEGVQRGDIDTVVLCDVLEHIYDPWKTMLTLRNLVSPTAQLLLSIPNVRNAPLIQDLISGHWRYRRAGLLDITHVRFFTRQDMYRMFYQTGFRVVTTLSTRCPLSAEIFERHINGSFPQQVKLDSISLTVHTPQDLSDLCTLQHVFMLRPAEYEDLSADERAWIDAPHPPTVAYAAAEVDYTQ